MAIFAEALAEMNRIIAENAKLQKENDALKTKLRHIKAFISANKANRLAIARLLNE